MKLRLFAIAALTLACLFALVPTVFPEAQHPLLHESRVQLGVPFQGGIDMTLVVQQREAEHVEVAADVAFLKMMAADRHLPDATIRLAYGSKIEIESDRSRAEVIRFINDRLGSYVLVESDGNVHQFALAEWRRQQNLNEATAQAMAMVHDRLSYLCNDTAVVESLSPGFIRLQLVGDMGFEPCS